MAISERRGRPEARPSLRYPRAGGRSPDLRRAPRQPSAARAASTERSRRRGRRGLARGALARPSGAPIGWGGVRWLWGTPRLRAGLQEGDEEAATSLRPAPPACSAAPAAPPGCSRLLSALSRLLAAPAWAWRRRVSAGEVGIRGSASSLSPRDTALGSPGDRWGPLQVPPEAGKGGGCPPADARVAARGGPAGGLRA